jgi:hypothetical protein
VDLALFFGLSGSLNGINVLHRSHLFAKLANGEAPACNYKVNGHDCTLGYYLADGIYQSWGTFVRTISKPKIKKEAEFAKAQEACQKDIDRAFGALQARFAIVRGPACFWDKKSLKNIMKACVILHNMVIEDDRDLNLEFSLTMLVAEWGRQRTPIASKHFLRYIGKLKTRPRILN